MTCARSLSPGASKTNNTVQSSCFLCSLYLRENNLDLKQYNNLQIVIEVDCFVADHFLRFVIAVSC